MTGNLHIITAPGDLAYAEAITRFQVDMAMESEGLALDHQRTLKGVQSVLLDESEEVTQVRLYVDKENTKAQAVYQKSGMSECHYLMYEVEV